MNVGEEPLATSWDAVAAAVATADPETAADLLHRLDPPRPVAARPTRRAQPLHPLRPHAASLLGARPSRSFRAWPVRRPV
ncbi:hypothetical protein [Nonomuraea salmonea]|uniref:hypothetical protein n=1 Tax=Nonomuraea salmonea TaxID=46181 RepID=UPI0031E5A851